jgi:hypothetical protein
VSTLEQAVSFFTKNLTEVLIRSFPKTEVPTIMRIKTQGLKNKVFKTVMRIRLLHYDRSDVRLNFHCVKFYRLNYITIDQTNALGSIGCTIDQSYTLGSMRSFIDPMIM